MSASRNAPSKKPNPTVGWQQLLAGLEPGPSTSAEPPPEVPTTSEEDQEDMEDDVIESDEGTTEDKQPLCRPSFP